MCSDICIVHASIHIYVQSLCLCSFIYTALNVIAAGICICSTAKTHFFHLLRGMSGCPNMEVCGITGNNYGLFSPNNTIGARSDTSVVILGDWGGGRGDVTVLMKLAPYWTGKRNTNFPTDTSALTT